MLQVGTCIKLIPIPNGINFESATSATTTNDPIAHRAVVGRLILGKYKVTSVKDIIAVAMCFVSVFFRYYMSMFVMSNDVCNDGLGLLYNTGLPVFH